MTIHENSSIFEPSDGPGRDGRIAAQVHRPVIVPDDPELDVAIVGGGIGGSLAAVLLGSAGYRVALIDMHRAYPPDFRCEKLAGRQIDLARRLGLFECITASSTPIRQMHVARFGRLVEKKESEEYGFFYQDMVNAVRAQIPPSVKMVVGRVADVTAGPDRQHVTLSDGTLIGARLVVIATGLGDALRHKVGVRRRIVRDQHTLVLGFSMVPAAGEAFKFPALTYYGETPRARMAYLCLFPIGAVMRANLFGYRSSDDSWTRGFPREPHAKLFEAMPGLRRFLGDFQLVDKVRTRLADLYEVEGYRRDGVVLVGDAFQTTCPAAGTGLDRVMTDVAQLCHVHIPRWLASPGMGAEKIAQFYDDPVKQACDAHSMNAAQYCRAITLDTALRWRAQRWVAYARPPLRTWIARSVERIRGTNVVKTLRQGPAKQAPVSLIERSLRPKDFS